MENENKYIKAMTGSIQRERHYGANGFELIVMVSFDAKEFNALKKRKQDPLAAGMAQIKNVVLDATGIRGVPSYAPQSYNQRFPRAKNGMVTLKLTFRNVSEFTLKKLGVNTKEWCLYHAVDLSTKLEETRDDGHLFAKSVVDETLRKLGGAQ